LTNTQFHMENN